MSHFRLLFVEDSSTEIMAFKRAVSLYKRQKDRTIEYVICEQLEDTFDNLDNSFDGAIIDLSLNRNNNAGNEIVARVREEQYRIPIAILTARPGDADQDFDYVKIYTKGASDSGYIDIFNRLWSIYRTGLTQIFGGRGRIEELLNDVFWRNLFPFIERWEQYGKIDSANTEKALLRHTMNHLIQNIDEDVKSYFPEEFYIFPPANADIRTGSILKEKETGKLFAVMSPECDVVLRDVKDSDAQVRNTDSILLIEVIPVNSEFSQFDSQQPNDLSVTTQKKIANASKRGHYHLLPQTEFFHLAFLNFRYISTVPEECMFSVFEIPPVVQIAPPFVKDIVARFSSYYARQGQPEVDDSNYAIFESRHIG